mmetsp:Transcript_158789/g.296002  ORF Transcript_158789/g.296002 Transcript_158789/m.296002 type:complete len:200 (-) Transcript_158789:45-644(-)
MQVQKPQGLVSCCRQQQTSARGKIHCDKFGGAFPRQLKLRIRPQAFSIQELHKAISAAHCHQGLRERSTLAAGSCDTSDCHVVDLAESAALPRQLRGLARREVLTVVVPPSGVHAEALKLRLQSIHLECLGLELLLELLVFAIHALSFSTKFSVGLLLISQLFLTLFQLLISFLQEVLQGFILLDINRSFRNLPLAWWL